MKKYFIILIINCARVALLAPLLITTCPFGDCYSQWVLQNSGVSSALYDIQFVDINTGWITGTNSVILKTTNGGLNWITQPSPLPPNRELNAIHMLNANTGYIGGWTNTFLKTTTGGNNWIEIPVPQGQYNDLFFINEQTGWLCAFLGVIRRTNNGGLSWDSLSTGNGGPLRNIQFLNEQTGWVVGRYYSGVFGTTDSGNNWDTLALIPDVRCLFFADQFNGWTGGINGLLYKTTNGGHNWSLQNVPVTGLFNDIYFLNDTIGWAANYNKIIHTSNGGEPVGISKLNNNIPVGFKLFQNYPNPFNSNTKIKFDVSKYSNVILKIYDIIGKEVSILVNENLQTGTYEINWNADNYSSGIYLCKRIADNFIETKKMILIK